jgi:hypothetical protein
MSDQKSPPSLVSAGAKPVDPYVQHLWNLLRRERESRRQVERENFRLRTELQAVTARFTRLFRRATGRSSS